MNFPVMVRYADCEDIFIDGAMRTVQLPVFNHLFGYGMILRKGLPYFCVILYGYKRFCNGRETEETA